MTLRLSALACDATDPDRLAAFWGELLGRVPSHDADEAQGVLLAGSPVQVGLRFVASASRRSGLNRVHLHLTSDAPGAQEATVARALALGASHLDVGQQPEEGHVVLADPEGNEFCVLEFGNSYLAGCGFLGELACDGTRAVGLFWAAALDWPLVWDQDEETAIQSPAGGTKVAWGGPPVAPRHGRNRQRFELAAGDGDGDLAAATDRLLGLGATRIASAGDEAADGGVELADPDGNEFLLRPA